MESDIELNSVLRRGMSSEHELMQKKRLALLLPTKSSAIHKLSYRKVIFLQAAYLVETLRGDSGDCTKQPWPCEAGSLRHSGEREEVIDLGDQIDLVVLARRPKALDMTDTDAVLVNYDPESDEFKRIAAESMEKESHCMYGPSFLVYERSSKPLPRIFLRQQEHAERGQELYPFLPLTDSSIARQQEAGNDVRAWTHGPLT